MLEVKQFVFNAFGENSYVLYDTVSRQCIFIDMGCDESQEAVVSEFVKTEKLHPIHSVHTHLHVDHVLGAPFVFSEYALAPRAHSGDAFIYERTEEYAAQLGLHIKGELPRLGECLEEGDVLQLGEYALQVIHIPGHSPGSIVLYCAETAQVWVGDVLFAGSIGRTDLWGGDYELLISGIQKKLLTLPGETFVYSGHGPATSIANEQKSNPFLR